MRGRNRRIGYLKESKKPVSRLRRGESFPGVDGFLQELETHCYSTAIVTLTGKYEHSFVIDLTRTEKGVRYGYALGHKELFLAKLLNSASETAAIILRSFTNAKNPRTGLPLKELRGYVVRALAGRIEFFKISPDEMRDAHCTDSRTGRPIAPEEDVIFC